VGIKLRSPYSQSPGIFPFAISPSCSFSTFMLWTQFGIFLKLSPALNIITVNKDLISSIIYAFPSFCPLYPHFTRMLIGLPVKKCYITASVLR